jgi:hypothetical protein
LREDVQPLRDEINRLKGEQGQPQIKPNQKPAGAAPTNHSSERERRQSKARHKTSKVDQIKVDREEVLKVDPAQWPADAQPKGYEDVTVQDMLITTDHVLFHPEKFYAPSANKTYWAP